MELGGIAETGSSGGADAGIPQPQSGEGLKEYLIRVYGGLTEALLVMKVFTDQDLSARHFQVLMEQVGHCDSPTAKAYYKSRDVRGTGRGPIVCSDLLELTQEELRR